MCVLNLHSTARLVRRVQLTRELKDTISADPEDLQDRNAKLRMQRKQSHVKMACIDCACFLAMQGAATMQGSYAPAVVLTHDNISLGASVSQLVNRDDHHFRASCRGLIHMAVVHQQLGPHLKACRWD